MKNSSRIDLGVLFALVFCSLTLGCRSEIGQANDRITKELRVCSENLQRLGVYEGESRIKRRLHRPVSRRNSAKRVPAETKIKHLVDRMAYANCDIIGLQEVGGRNAAEANKTVKNLGDALSRESGRRFLGYAGQSKDESIRNGFLVAEDVGTDIEFFSYLNEPLVRLVSYGPVGTFFRGPVGVTLKILTPTGDRKNVYILNLHFKSRSRGYQDPQQLDFETLRIEMAETARRLFVRERERYAKDGIAVLLGDRNNDAGSATAETLAGFRQLEDFRSRGVCQVDKRLKPACGEKPRRPAELLPVLETIKNQASTTSPWATYRYQGEEQILDEILIPHDLRRLIERDDRSLRAGTVGEYSVGSDHKLVWVTFRFP